MCGTYVATDSPNLTVRNHKVTCLTCLRSMEGNRSERMD